MIPIPSKLEGHTFPLYKLEQAIKPLGYSIGGNWDYDHGYFDYKMDNGEGAQYLRIPFVAVSGQLDEDGAVVEVVRPFVLGHKYELGIDEEATIGNFSASINQFQEPEDSDAEVPQKFVDLGKELVEELEATLME